MMLPLIRLPGLSQGMKRRILYPISKGENYLEISLPEMLPERTPPVMILRRKMSIHSLVDHIRNAGEQKWITGILLKVAGFRSSLTKSMELREALARFKEKGKKVIVYLTQAGNVQYFLATIGDLIILNPTGTIFLPGFAAEATFLKGLMDRLGIKSQFERVGNYKSAPDVFTRESLSKEHRREITEILDKLYNIFIENLSNARSIPPESLKRIVKKGFFSPKEAKKHGLVDELLYPDQVPSFVKGHWNKDITIIPQSETPPLFHIRPVPRSIPKAAVLFVEGYLREGENIDDPVHGVIATGSDTVSTSIEKIRKDSTIEGCVVRVNTGGGSAIAADTIWREIRRLNDTKPVVISMGDIAASGGYYISCAGSEILALSSTITGSIGVFFGKFVIRDLLNRFGITRQGIKKGPMGDIFSAYRLLTKRELEIMRRNLLRSYNDFKSRVREGRGMSSRKVESAAKGRVWLGSQAVGRGLVDRIGGLEEALERLKEIAGIPPEKKLMVTKWPRRWVLEGYILKKLLKGGMELHPALINYNWCLEALDHPGIMALYPYHDVKIR